MTKNINRSEWSIKSGYNKKLSRTAYPSRLFNSGKSNGLELILSHNERDTNFVCDGIMQHFTVFLNAPGESLETQIENFVQISEDVQIQVEPKLNEFSKGLSDYESNNRKCYFNYERKLRFFHNYTYSNCGAVCIANFTKQECGCVSYDMPSKCRFSSFNAVLIVNRW